MGLATHPARHGLGVGRAPASVLASARRLVLPRFSPSPRWPQGARKEWPGMGIVPQDCHRLLEGLVAWCAWTEWLLPPLQAGMWFFGSVGFVFRVLARHSLKLIGPVH